jgi:hypothetical protein
MSIIAARLPPPLRDIIEEYCTFRHPCAKDIWRKYAYTAKWRYERSESPLHLVGRLAHDGFNYHRPQSLQKRNSSRLDSCWVLFETPIGVVSTTNPELEVGHGNDFLARFWPERVQWLSAANNANIFGVDV